MYIIGFHLNPEQSRNSQTSKPKINIKILNRVNTAQNYTELNVKTLISFQSILTRVNRTLLQHCNGLTELPDFNKFVSKPVRTL